MASSEHPRVETFETPGALRLELRIPAGEILVEAGDGAETRVELAASDSHERSHRAVEGATVARRNDGGVDVVEVSLERRFSLGRTPAVSARVRCPAGADLVVDAASTDVESRGRLGAVDVHTASGDVTVENADGDVSVRSASGDAKLGRVGAQLTLQSVSGDARVSVAAGPLRAKLTSGDLAVEEATDVNATTVSGDVRIGRVSEGRVELHAVSGDLSIGVARGSRLAVDATTVGGNLRSDVELDPTPGDGAGPLVELHARTISGDLHVHRA